MTKREDVRKLVDTAVETYGRIDVLINNAGLMPLSPMDRLKVDEWDRMIDVNLKGVLYGVAAALPHMQQQKSGHIINLSSVAGHKIFGGSAVYSATKSAVRVISEGLRQEMAPHNIRVTIISPGAVKTELLEHISEADVRRPTRTTWARSAFPPKPSPGWSPSPSASPRRSASTKSSSGRRPRSSETASEGRREVQHGTGLHHRLVERLGPSRRATARGARAQGGAARPRRGQGDGDPGGAPGVEDVVEGDLETMAGMRAVAEAANALGRFDAVIHNAGVGDRGADRLTKDGLPVVFAVNVLAPYLLTALMERPDRLVYLSSSMHMGARPARLAAYWQDGRWVGADQLLADQVPGHGAGLRGSPALARGAVQRGGSGLGAHPDGRPFGARRPGGGRPDPGVVGRGDRARGARDRAVPAPPAHTRPDPATRDAGVQDETLVALRADQRRGPGLKLSRGSWSSSLSSARARA